MTSLRLVITIVLFTCIPLEELFAYPFGSGELAESELLAFYWKGGIKCLDQEAAFMEMEEADESVDGVTDT